MTVKYGEILRLASKGFSRRNIALSVPCSRNTVAKVLERAKELNLSWPLPDKMDELELSKLLFGQENKTLQSCRRMPNYEYIRKELLKNGVNRKLLWTEYLEECRQCGEQPLMYSQFCYHIQQDEQKRRATAKSSTCRTTSSHGPVRAWLTEQKCSANSSTAPKKKPLTPQPETVKEPGGPPSGSF